MSRSSAESDIRDAVVLRLRQIMPGSRIVHEMNVAGTMSNRLDVVAVDRRVIVGVEIKSEKDTLDRLADQWAAFSKCCHHVLVAAHTKHFREYRSEHLSPDRPGELNLNHPLFFGKWWRGMNHVWHFPKPIVTPDPWRVDERMLRSAGQPRAHDMLEMLWSAELRAECGRHGIATTSRSTTGVMMREMVWRMTGQEICEAVCRQLRGRRFAEADAPIFEPADVVAEIPAAKEPRLI